MSEEANELRNNGESMSSAEFEARLTDFFSQHKESKLKLVPRLVDEFRGQENIVLEHLHNKYVLGIVTEKPKKKHSKKDEGATAESAHIHESAAVAEPKSKKKLILIIVISVVVIGLGVAAFLMKDKFLGKKGEPAKTETAPAESQPPAEQPKEETAPAPSTLTDSVTPATPDTAGAIPTDSVPAQ